MNPWMRIAYEEALAGMQNNEGGPFGAVIVRNNEIIASAHNEVLRTNDPTAHAEINAIRKASQALSRHDLSDCALYATCYPCPMCLGAVLWARIPTVYYGATQADASEGEFDDERFHTLLHHPETAVDLRPLDLDTVPELFQKWLKKSDRKRY